MVPADGCASQGLERATLQWQPRAAPMTASRRRASLSHGRAAAETLAATPAAAADDAALERLDALLCERLLEECFDRVGP
jgi:hypothetical protein